MKRHRMNRLNYFGLICLALFSLPSFATPPAPAPTSVAQDGYEIGVRIITAKSKGKFKVDKKLKPLSKDLRALPFKKFKQRDMHKKVLRSSEQVSLQFPSGKGNPQLLSIQAHGKQPNGKLGFTLAIDNLDFKTRVALPDGGTILVAGPKHNKETVLFSVTAREYSAAAAQAETAAAKAAKPKKPKIPKSKRKARKKKPKKN